jgi:hypothetical protein
MAALISINFRRGIMANRSILIISILIFSIPNLCFAQECDDGAGIQKCAIDQNTEQYNLILSLDDLLVEVEKLTANGIQSKSALVLATDDEELSDSRKRLAKVAKERDRAEDSLEETSDEDYLEILAQGAKVKKKKCNKWSEVSALTDDTNAKYDYLPAGTTLLPPNHEKKGDLGNGICDAFYVKDIDGKEFWVRERSQPNICVRECENDDKIYSGSGKNKKEKIKDRFVDRMTDNIIETQDATLKIDDLIVDLEAANLIASQFGAASALASVYPDCDFPSGTIGDEDLLIAKLALVSAKHILDFVAITAETIEQTTKDGCQQDVLGANVSTACAPLTIATFITKGLIIVLEVAIDGVDLLKDANDLDTGDVTNSCFRRIASEQALIRSTVNSNNKLAEEIQEVVGEPDPSGNTISLTDRMAILESAVLQNKEYIINMRTIVLTPHGQRDRVPLFDPVEEP